MPTSTQSDFRDYLTREEHNCPNRRVRNRMHGGVGGRGCKVPSYPDRQEQDIEGFNSVETPFPGLHVRNDVRSLFIQQVLRALVSAPLLKEPQLRTQHVRGGMRPPSFHARCGNQPPRRSALYAIIESVVANKGGYTLLRSERSRHRPCFISGVASYRFDPSRCIRSHRLNIGSRAGRFGRRPETVKSRRSAGAWKSIPDC